ncbi:MAG: sigma-54 dependent transcriptional regulator [Aquificaceae bacterium]|nr:sigma-54 dependent transcriptional regulator [Aquificaceae bacterium]
MARILIVEDERTVRETLKNILQEEGYSVQAIDNIKSIFQKAHDWKFDCVLLDLWLKDGNAFDSLCQILEAVNGAPVIVITGHGRTESAVKAIKCGAFDFLEKPFSLHNLLKSVKEAIGYISLRDKEPIYGNSERILELKRTIIKLSSSNLNILLYGESGSGKDLIAKTIHNLSNKEGEFIKLSCSGLTSIDISFFKRPQRATIYLDEVSDLNETLQARLRSILDNLENSADFRLISSTSKDPDKTIRSDLRFRLSQVLIKLPSLREIKEDIPLIAHSFLNDALKRLKKPPRSLSAKAQDLIMNLDWRGNFRELKNAMETIAILHDGNTVTETQLINILGLKDAQDFTHLHSDLRSARQDFERRFILRRLEENGFDLRKTAESLGIDLSNLYRKLRQLDIEI